MLESGSIQALPYNLPGRVVHSSEAARASMSDCMFETTGVNSCFVQLLPITLYDC